MLCLMMHLQMILKPWHLRSGNKIARISRVVPPLSDEHARTVDAYSDKRNVHSLLSITFQRQKKNDIENLERI